jgi:hypothetical protein
VSPRKMAPPEKRTFGSGSGRKFDFEFECDIDLPAGLAAGQQITLPGGLEFVLSSPLGQKQKGMMKDMILMASSLADHRQVDANKTLSESTAPELSGNGVTKESAPSLNLSAVLSGGESSTDSSTTNTGILSQTQTLKSIQTTIEIKGLAVDSSNPSTPKALESLEQPIRSSKALQAARDSGAKSTDREPRNKIAARLEKLNLKKAKRMVSEKDPKFCPGVDKCRDLACNHTNLRNATLYEIK